MLGAPENNQLMFRQGMMGSAELLSSVICSVKQGKKGTLIPGFIYLSPNTAKYYTDPLIPQPKQKKIEPKIEISSSNAMQEALIWEKKNVISKRGSGLITKKKRTLEKKITKMLTTQ